MEELADQVALVTGGGRGIGRGIVVELAKAGAAVAINYHRDRRRPPRKSPREVERAGGQALLLPGDVADLAAVEDMVAETVAAFGRLTIARGQRRLQRPRTVLRGRSGRISPHDRRHDVGAFYLLRAAARQMIAPAGGIDRPGQFAPRLCPHPAVDGLQHVEGGHQPDGPHRRDRAGRASDSRQHHDAGLDRHAGRAKIRLGRNDCSGGQEASLGTAGTAGRDRPRRRLFLRSAERIHHRLRSC